ncbi:MAG: 23S rRNA (guanosine(2251)-2'-O)-methyltransferase RlmB [Halanaerobium sp.]|nr:23S rRNA (guanosine(2251)-2'-O)-methyltransferase RlmB [Halanaerobium sp.]
MDIVIGRNPVQEVLQGSRQVSQVFLARGTRGKPVDKILDMARKKGVPVEYIPREELAEKADSGSHQGVLAYVEEFTYASLEEIIVRSKKKGTAPFLIILDQIQDPHNLGSIIRTAEALGADGIIIPAHRACGITPTVSKTSAGAVEHIPVAQVTNINHTISELKEKGIWIYGLEMTGENQLSATDLKGPLALVVGSEGSGLRRLVKENCDFLVQIPLRGQINSLNASVAAGIMIYEIFRQRAGL